MIQKIKNQKKSYKAFTLIEMVIVLVIIGIMLMATIFLSGEQIQKVKDKTVKESILAEMQSRYSRNLGSSSYGGVIYDSMEVTFSTGSNKIQFKYNERNSSNSSSIENTFTDRFEIMNIATDGVQTGSITLKYSPYQITCHIGTEEESKKNVVMLVRVNDSKYYCFEIQQKNCRLLELSESKCNALTQKN